jgi:outer membrane protein assembly factor BamA
MTEDSNNKKLSEALLNPDLDPLDSSDSAAGFEKAAAFYYRAGKFETEVGYLKTQVESKVLSVDLKTIVGSIASKNIELKAELNSRMDKIGSKMENLEIGLTSKMSELSQQIREQLSSVKNFHSSVVTIILISIAVLLAVIFIFNWLK